MADKPKTPPKGQQNFMRLRRAPRGRVRFFMEATVISTKEVIRWSCPGHADLGGMRSGHTPSAIHGIRVLERRVTLPKKVAPQV